MFFSTLFNSFAYILANPKCIDSLSRDNFCSEFQELTILLVKYIVRSDLTILNYLAFYSFFVLRIRLSPCFQGYEASFQLVRCIRSGTIFVVLLWTFSSARIYSLKCRDHTLLVYSRCEWTNTYRVSCDYFLSSTRINVFSVWPKNDVLLKSCELRLTPIRLLSSAKSFLACR